MTEQQNKTEFIQCNKDDCDKQYWPEHKEQCKTCQYNQTVPVEELRE